jgi:hypothetical protein
MLAVFSVAGVLFGDLFGEESFGLLEFVFAGLWKVFAGAVDVEVQHAHT